MARDQLVLCMNGGVGDTSYTNNSTVQLYKHKQKVIMKVNPILEESVKRLLYCNNFKNKIKVADLGCSSGPNALNVMDNIITIVDNTKFTSLNREKFVVLQFYLNDLFENDFNNIFKLLSTFSQSIQEKQDKVSECFVNVTPGNFYGRLFPNNYIHFFHSSYSIHWLSQAPEELTKGVEALNKDNIYITTSSPEIVYKAYLEQFQRDFILFLKSRVEELKPGGGMVLAFQGREKAREISHPLVITGMVLNDMVLEGLVEETKLESFNLPIYFPTVEEVRQVIETEGSFALQTLETFKVGWDANYLEEEVGDSVLVESIMRGEFIAKTIRAVFEPLLTVGFGKDIMDELFSRLAKKVSQLVELGTSLEYTNLVVSMHV